MSDCIICWVSALTMALSPRGLRLWVRAVYIFWWQNQQSNHFFNLSLNQYSIRQVTTILRNLKVFCDKVNDHLEKISLAARLWFSWKKCSLLSLISEHCVHLLLWRCLSIVVASYSEFRSSPAPTTSGTCVHHPRCLPGHSTHLTAGDLIGGWPAKGGICALFKEGTNLKAFLNQV